MRPAGRRWRSCGRPARSSRRAGCAASSVVMVVSPPLVGPNTASMTAAGAAGHQGHQPQQRIARAAVVAGLVGEDARFAGLSGHCRVVPSIAHTSSPRRAPQRWPWRPPGRRAGRTAPAAARPRDAGGPGPGPRRSGSPPAGLQAGAQPLPHLPDSPARRTDSRPAADTPPPGRAVPHPPLTGRSAPGPHRPSRTARSGSARPDDRARTPRRHRDRAGDDRLFHSGAPVGVVLEDKPLYRSSAACSPTGQPRLDRPHRTLTTRHCG